MPLTLKRWLAVVFLMLFGGYHLACFVQYRDFSKGWRPSSFVGTNLFWFARWKMFTGLSTYHTVPEFQGRSHEHGMEWETLPMDEWYPARWESGYRWERPPVYKLARLQDAFLNLACERSGAQEVRMILHRWKATLGQREQPKRKYTKKQIRTFVCGDEIRRPKGVRL